MTIAPSGAETGTFWKNKVNRMDSDAVWLSLHCQVRGSFSMD